MKTANMKNGMKTTKRITALLLCVFMMLGVFPAFSAQAADQVSPEQMAELLLRTMKLEEKIGQMIMPAFQTWSNGKTNVSVTTVNEQIAEAIRTCGFGGVALFSVNVSGTASGARLISDMQAAALESGAGIPLLIGADQEGGTIYRLRTGTEFCGNMALGATGDPALAEQAASVIGKELAAMGINTDFAPCLDINNNPDNPIIGLRSFSDDPVITAEFGRAYIEGLHNAGVTATVKHFPGHGDTDTDSHTGLPRIDKTLEELRQNELVPFRTAVEAGADMVMTTHIQFPKIEKTTYKSISTGKEVYLPATLSRTFITDILRGELGFEGVVCTDALSMEAISKHFDRLDAARLAINAGADILLMPMALSSKADVDACRQYIRDIAAMVKSGKISEKTINAAVTRILLLKLKNGIMDTTVNRDAQAKKALSVVGSRENHDIEWEIMKKAVTLVKNDDKLLPVKIPENGKVAMFCTYPNEVPMMEYGIQRLKEDGFLPKSAVCRVYCYQTHTASYYRTVVKDADFVIGSVETYSSADLKGGFQATFLDGLIAEAHEYGKKIAVVSIQLPYDLARYSAADALLAVYNSEGMNDGIPSVYNGETRAYGVNLSAAVYAIFGGADPTGRLPVNIPELDPSFGYTKNILYPRGFGLSYDGVITPSAIPFIDVPKGTWYTDAVEWACVNKITSGTGNGLFSPDRECTRAEMTAFLWHCAGDPAAEDVTLPFDDVPENVWYADAVRWAYANEIVFGTDDSTFSPEMLCTRAQIVALLARYTGSTESETATGYSDVPEDAYYASAVCWAEKCGLTYGTGDGKFSPDLVCTRAQMVTFLYRLAAQ